MLARSRAWTWRGAACSPQGSRIPYDYLILAPGRGGQLFRPRELARVAPGMKDVEEATLIRSRLLRSFERPRSRPTLRSAPRYLTFIIVGGGPTGVELAGAIKELAVDVIPRDFRVADTRRARVMLIEAGPRLLPGMHAGLLGAGAAATARARGRSASRAGP